MGTIIQMLADANAVQNTILGIGTVFIMLIIISLIIYCFRFIPKLLEQAAKKPSKQPKVEQKAAPKAVEQKPAAPQKPKEAAPVAAPAPSLMDDMELIAVISAAIAASEQIQLDGFIVRTIKKRA